MENIAMTDKIDLEKDVNLNADELEQVKGGGAVAGDKTRKDTSKWNLATGKVG